MNAEFYALQHGRAGAYYAARHAVNEQAPRPVSQWRIEKCRAVDCTDWHVYRNEGAPLRPDWEVYQITGTWCEALTYANRKAAGQ